MENKKEFTNINQEEMKMKHSYYKEMMKCLEENPMKEPYSSITTEFFKECQLYYAYYLINDKIRDAKNLLKNYVEKKDNNTQTKESTNNHVTLDIVQKMYVEVFVNLYNEKYKNVYSWSKLINNKEEDIALRKMIFKERYPESGSYIHKKINTIINSDSTYLQKKPDISKMHKAMEKLKEALNIPCPSIEESVESVISSDYLELLLNQLKCNNIGGFVMTIGQIRRALTEGTYHKYIKGNSNVIFNLKSDHNLSEIRKCVCIPELKELLELYEETKEEIAELN